MKQLFNKYLIGSLLLLCVLLAPAYKSEAASAASGPFVFNASLDKKQTNSGTVDIGLSIGMSYTSNWDPNTMNNPNYVHSFILSQGWMEKYCYYNETARRNGGCLLSYYNPGSTANNEAEGGGYSEGLISGSSQSGMTATIYDSSDKVVNITNIDSSSTNVVGSNPSRYYNKYLSLTGISKLPEGSYYVVFKSAPRIYSLHEYCDARWYDNHCGWTHLGYVDKYVTANDFPMNITVPFTIGAPLTLIDGRISTTYDYYYNNPCAIAENKNTCTGGTSWGLYLSGLLPTGGSITLTNDSTAGSDVIVSTNVTGTYPEHSGSHTPTFHYGKNSLKLKYLNSSYVPTEVIADEYSVNVGCLSNLIWDSVSQTCIKKPVTLAAVNVTVSPYVDAAQKTASVIKGDPVTLTWSSTNATACSCSDSNGKDCFAKGSYINPNNNTPYAGFIGDTKQGKTDPIYVSEYTKFSISCK